MWRISGENDFAAYGRDIAEGSVYFDGYGVDHGGATEFSGVRVRDTGGVYTLQPAEYNAEYHGNDAQAEIVLVLWWDLVQQD